MTKLLIICGGDRLGKGSIIKNLCNYYDYKNIIIRHCDKPPTNLKNNILDYQFKVFTQELNFIIYVKNMNRNLMYHDNIIIYDRFYLGEYVYGSMFRGYDKQLIKNKILDLEKKYLYENDEFIPYLITLIADPEFFNSRKSDSHELSKTLEQKTKELKLFKEAHEFSIIKNKHLIKVDKDCIFREKSDILNEAINFINK